MFLCELPHNSLILRCNIKSLRITKGFLNDTSLKCDLVSILIHWITLLQMLSTISDTLSLSGDQQPHAYARSKTCLFYFIYYYAFLYKFILMKFLYVVLEIDTLGTYTVCYEALSVSEKGWARNRSVHWWTNH